MVLYQEWIKSICASVIFLASLCGFILFFCRSSNFFSFYVESLYTSLFFSIALFYHLPECFEKDSTSYNRSNLILTAVFLIFMIAELLSRYFSDKLFAKSEKLVKNDISNFTQMQTILIPYLENNGKPATSVSNILLGIRLFCSSCLMGLAMGITKNDNSVFPILVTVILHKFLETLAIGARLKDRVRNVIYWVISVFYSLITPAVTIFVNHFLPFDNDTSLSICDSISGAFFIYIAFSHWRRLFFSPYEYSRNEIIGMSISFITGNAAVAIAAIFL